MSSKHRTHWDRLTDKLIDALKASRKAQRKFTAESYSAAFQEERERRKVKTMIPKLPKMLYD
jgi:hypothetical protein